MVQSKCLTPTKKIPPKKVQTANQRTPESEAEMLINSAPAQSQLLSVDGVRGTCVLRVGETATFASLR